MKFFAFSQKFFERYPIYPWVIGLFPVFSLLIVNSARVQLDLQWRTLLLPFLLFFLFFGVARKILNDTTKADLITMLFGVLFFSYGHLLNAISLILILSAGQSFETIQRYGRLQDQPNLVRLIFVGWLLFVFVTIFLIAKLPRNLKPIANAAQNLAIGMIVILVGNFLLNQFSQKSSSEYRSNWGISLQTFRETTDLTCPQNPPDIFYIIPDSYAGEDVLEDIYNLKNANFLNFLEQQGFTVLRQSHSNYVQTPLSLASSLNLKFLDDVAQQMGETSQNRIPLQEMIQDSRIAAVLKSCGYTIIGFSTGFGPTKLRSTDVYLSPKQTLTDLENEILNLTPLPTLSAVFAVINPYEIQRQRVEFTFEQLPLLHKNYIDTPIFVFAHLTVPHHPFVFDANGQPVNSQSPFAITENMRGDNQAEYIHGYCEQVQYVNWQLMKVLPEIIAQNPENTIVILQSDHGPSATLDWQKPDARGLHERFSILNAWYLPPSTMQMQLEQEQTPVNAFIFILNHYFDANLPFEQNTGYFSTLEQPYQFTQWETP